MAADANDKDLAHGGSGGAAGHADKIAQLTRLYRSSEALSGDTRALLKALLLEEAGQLEAPTERSAPVEQMPVPPLVREPQATRPARLDSASDGQVNQAPASPVPTTPAVATPRAPAAVSAAPAAPTPITAAAIELKLRQLVEADAPWEQLAPWALGLYQSKPGPEAAARVIELAFLHASSTAIDELLRRFRRECQEFYRHLHPTLRVHLVVRQWQQGKAETLAALLYNDRDQDYLQGGERLLICRSLMATDQAPAALLYFRRFHRDILAAVRDLGMHVDLTPAAFLLDMGKLALHLGYHADGAALLEQIGATEPERDEALRLMLNATVEKNKVGQSHLVESVMAQAGAEGRLRLLAGYLADTRQLGGHKDRSRPALNELLMTPLAWLPETADSWAALSRLLVENRDLGGLLPHLWEVFRANALKFHNPVLDAALWQGLLAIRPQNADEEYWQGVAFLHHYAVSGPGNEAELWRAFDLVLKAKRGAAQALPHLWRELQRTVFGWVAKTPYLLEPDRVRMLRQLRVAVSAKEVTTVDLEEYLIDTEGAPLAVLVQLQSVAETKQAPLLASRFLLRRAAASHLTNADVNHLWQLANLRQDSDLAWRCATVLQARGALTAACRHSWQISGERRSDYAYHAPSAAVVTIALAGMRPAAQRLAKACLQIGGVLPELLALLDPGAAPLRPVSAPPGSIEASVDKALGVLPWLAAPRKRYRFSFEAGVGGTPLPAFMQVLPANPWSLLCARLAERLGINAWGWRLSRLQAQIVDLIPRLASRQDLRRHSGRVATWLKALTPEQRAAWQELAALSRSVDDVPAAEALADFVCRLATLIYPNHSMALTSLQAMRANVAITWSFETWLLGEAYSQARKTLGTGTRVLVPNALQRLASIVGYD